jgi:hypothetical protein
MPTPLVVIVPRAEKDALRDGGVLPPAWFGDVGDSGWNFDGAAVRIWDAEPDWEAAGEAGEPPLPARLLGLSSADRSAFAAEDIVAKFFGAFVLHIVFLDEEDDDNGSGPRRRNPTTAWVGVEPILRVARWAGAFNRSVEYWFSDEQSRNIRHAALVVARGGRVRLSEERLKALQAEFTDHGALKTCFFIDGRLEVELGNDALHAACLWPVLAGRLLLRLLVALSSPGTDDLLLPGVHLWRSFEFLFDYPVAEMTEMVTTALTKAYKNLERQTDAVDGKEPPHKKILSAKNSEASTFAGIPTALSGGDVKHPPEVDDWHSYPVDVEKDNRLDDKRRWSGPMARARDNFAQRELELFQAGENDGPFSPSFVFPSVAKDPKNVSIELRRSDANRPSDTIDGGEVYKCWRKVVEKEMNRQKSKKTLEAAAKELKAAQKHYVTAPYGMLVFIATSLVCGLTIFRAALSLGAAPVASVILASFSALGACLAWLFISWLHRRSGTNAARQFIDVADAVDDAMDARHCAAVETVKMAETQHRTALRIGSWAALRRLLERVWRILSIELQSPSLSAFYRGDASADAAEEQSLASAEADAKRERDAYLQYTRFSEVLTSGAFAIGRSENSDRVLNEALNESGQSSFVALWQRICDKSDRYHCGNLPARVLIPEIRRWLRALCDRLCAAQKADLLAARGVGEKLPAQISIVRGDSGFILATAHVDDHEAAESPARVFVFEEPESQRDQRRGQGAAQSARTLIGGAFMDIPVTETPILNGLPQVAFYFQDIRLYGIGRDDDGRLSFLSRHEALDMAGHKGGAR